MCAKDLRLICVAVMASFLSIGSNAVAQPPPGLEESAGTSSEAPPGLGSTSTKLKGQEGESVAPPFAGDAFPTVDGGFGGFDTGFGGGFGGSDQKITYSATFKMDDKGTSGRVMLQAEVLDGFYTYSVTSGNDGALPTTITLPGSAVKLKGPFTPDSDPKLDDKEFPGVIVEKHLGTVVWTAPFVAKQPLTEESKIAVEVDGQVCGGGTCLPVTETVQAKFAGRLKPASTLTEIRPEGTHAGWSAKLSSSAVTPGSSATLSLTVSPDEGYHVYKYVPGDDETTFRTLIVATTKSGLKFGAPTTGSKIKSMSVGPDSVEYYAGKTTWEIPVTVPESAESGEYPIELSVGFYTCDDKSCDPPSGIVAAGKLIVADKSDDKPMKLGMSEGSFYDVADSDALTTWIDEEKTLVAETSPLTLIHILAALGGGFILNFMPCVLPVIGLKVLSFVDQAGNDHRRVITLNLSFVAGIVAVMLALGLLTVAVKAISGQAFGWGEQFTHLEFKVALAGLVFAMALSFLGVWEIPIPGFAMSSKSNELMQKEGLTGAFLKGILTTVLATPCSGPLLGSLFGLALVLSPINVLILYTVVGIGMSLPYLALCVYPGFVDMLPKPGAWMETLKQLLAFPLLLTVVFFFASVDAEYRVATLLMLIFVWFACWMIGKVPPYANADRRLTAWASAGVVIALGVVVSFKYFGPVDHRLPWVEYNEPQLAQFRKEGKTVMVEFTANWCWNCQVNMRTAIDTDRVAEVVRENGVTPMVADWTSRSPEIQAKLHELGSNSIPLLVVYPADPEAEPIILPDLLTENQVVKALEEAGPSQDVPEGSRLTSQAVH